MSLPLLIIGAGGHGRVLADLALSLGREMLGFLDRDANSHGALVDGIQVLGGDEQLAEYPAQAVSLVNGIGSTDRPDARRELYLRFTAQGYRFEALCHPRATLGRFVTLGEGAQVMAGCVVQTGAQIGENVILNTGAIVEHDTVVGAHSHLAPGAVVCGGATIGENCHIGVGAVVVQGLTVGDGALVAAGAVVVKDILPGERVAGLPATRMGQK